MSDQIRVRVVSYGSGRPYVFGSRLERSAGVAQGFSHSEPTKRALHNSLSCKALQVGAGGFEPPTLCSQSRCASQTALRPETIPSRRGEGRCFTPWYCVDGPEAISPLGS